MRKKELIEKYSTMSLTEIAESENKSPETIRQEMIRLNIPRRKYKTAANLTNEVFGSLKVIQMIKEKNRTLCLCQCECGNEVKVRSGDLKAGNNTSCGCRINNKGSRHKQWLGFKEISGYVWAGIQDCAKRQGWDFQLSIEDAWLQFEKQKRTCALSGMEIKFPKTAKDKREGSMTASLDRIDSKLGYTKNNIQWVHKSINKAKSDLTQHDFIQMCKLVAKFND